MGRHSVRKSRLCRGGKRGKEPPILGLSTIPHPRQLPTEGPVRSRAFLVPLLPSLHVNASETYSGSTDVAAFPGFVACWKLTLTKARNNRGYWERLIAVCDSSKRPLQTHYRGGYA